MEYPYPEDEFDEAAKSGGHRGVHRVPRSTWAKIWPFLAVLVIFPLAAILLVNALSKDRLPDTTPTPTTVAQTTEATATDTSTPSPTDTATDTATPATSPTATPSASPTPTPNPQLFAKILVYNGAGIQGLAAAAAQVLTDADFSNVTPDTYTGTAVTSSIVVYADDAFEATADKVADELGLTSVEQDAVLVTGGNDVVVYLKTDFR